MGLKGAEPLFSACCRVSFFCEKKASKKLAPARAQSNVMSYYDKPVNIQTYQNEIKKRKDIKGLKKVVFNITLNTIKKTGGKLPPVFYSTDLYVVINNDLFFFGQEGRRILYYCFWQAPGIRHVQLV